MFDLDWGGDLKIAPNGGVLSVNGWDEARQSTVRAVLTNPAGTLPSGTVVPPDYVFEPTYGAGIGLYVGQDMTSSQVAELQAKISEVVLTQEFVDQAVAPTVTVQNAVNGGQLISVAMRLVNNQSGTILLAQG